jgi:uncharacterized protein YndB with AHSA1/START domain
MAAAADAASAERPERSAGRELILSRVLDAPRQLVFRLWVDPQHAARWWAPRDCVLVACDMDVRPGGAWRRDMATQDGRVVWKRGVYREIVEPERLVFTYADEGADGTPGQETLVTVTFAEENGKARLTLHQGLFDTIERRDGHRGGWTSALERLAGYLASA